MAAFKKGQGWHGPYTDNKPLTTPSPVHDDQGYRKPPVANVGDAVNASTTQTPRYIKPITAAPGLSAVEPKKTR